MKSENMIDILKLLQNQIKESFGCTEPGAIGLATSIAYNALKGELPTEILVKEKIKKQPLEIMKIELSQDEIEKIIIKVDRDVYRNALHVGIPGTGELSGINIAVAQGVFCNPNKELNLFTSFNGEKSLVDKLINEGRIKIIPKYDENDIYIEANVEAKNHAGICRIQYTHSNITCIKRDNELFYEDGEKEEDSNINKLGRVSNLQEIIVLAEKTPEEAKGLLQRVIQVNKAAAEFAIRQPLKFAPIIKKLVKKGKLSDGSIAYAKYITMSTIETRMVGYDMHVMTCAGSGNLGLMVTLPIIAVAEKNGEENEEKLIKAVCLANLITIYATEHSGYLSAICGCSIKAGFGAVAGIAYYLGGDNKKIGAAINNFAATIPGMICGGANIGCALKASRAVGAAIESAELAFNGEEMPPQGIVDKDPLITINNTGILSEAMIETDKKMLGIYEK